MKFIYSIILVISSLINGILTMPIHNEQISFYILDTPSHSGSVLTNMIPPPPPPPVLYAIVPPSTPSPPPGPILNENIPFSTFFPELGPVIIEQ